jgi:hypothetical protein
VMHMSILDCERPILTCGEMKAVCISVTPVGAGTAFGTWEALDSVVTEVDQASSVKPSSPQRRLRPVLSSYAFRRGFSS